MRVQRTLEQLEKALMRVDRTIAKGEEDVIRLDHLLGEGQPGSADTLLAHSQIRVFRDVLHTLRSLRSHLRRHRTLWRALAA